MANDPAPDVQEDAFAVEPRLRGLSLRGYASVSAGVEAGLGLDSVLENEGIDPEVWRGAEGAFRARLAEDVEREGGLQEAFDERLAAAQERYGRPLPPLDEDLAAWLDFVRLSAAQPELLEKANLRPADLARLQRKWAARMAEDPAVARQAETILGCEPLDVPEIRPGAAAPAKPPPEGPAIEEPWDEEIDEDEPISSEMEEGEEAPALFTPMPYETAEAEKPQAPVAAALPIEPPALAVAPPPALQPLPEPVFVPPPRIPSPPPPAIAPMHTLPPGFVLTPPLPFHAALPEEPRPPWPAAAREVRLDQTLPPDSAAPAPATLPFREVAISDKPQAPGPKVHAERKSDRKMFETMAMPAVTSIPATPFEEEAEDPLNKTMVFVEPSEANRAAAAPAPAELTLEVYASLCAELAVARDPEPVFARYGLASAEQRNLVDRTWKERLRESPELYREWQRLYQEFYARIGARRT